MKQPADDRLQRRQAATFPNPKQPLQQELEELGWMQSQVQQLAVTLWKHFQELTEGRQQCLDQASLSAETHEMAIIAFKPCKRTCAWRHYGDRSVCHS
eukprot:2201529-Amphidinium_carterae.2